MIMEQMMENIYNTYQNTCRKKSKIKRLIPTEVDASPTSRCFGDRATGI